MIASNRKNGRKSRGPKTVEGKNVVRRNALKHGLTAKTLVVLGECEADFQAMADRHLAVFQPRNDVELEFCKTFTLAAWRRHRCVTAEAGITNERIRATQLDEAATARSAALALGQRLLHDRKGIWQRYLDPLAEYRANYREQSGPPGQVAAPAQLVAELESTLEGCRFLLEHWRELRTHLNCERGWKALDMFMCIRLLGREPLDVLDEPPGDLMDIFLACRKIDGSDKGPFDELRCVVSDVDLAMVLKRLKRMGYEARTPASEDHARSIVNNLVDRNVSRLEALFQAQEARAVLDAAERAHRLMFDPSDDTEKSRRYGDICVRQMTRACEELIKIRRSGFGDEDGESEPLDAYPLDEPGSVPIPADVGLTEANSVRAENVAGMTESRTLTGGAHGAPPSVLARCRNGEPASEPGLAQERGSGGADSPGADEKSVLWRRSDGSGRTEIRCEQERGWTNGSEPRMRRQAIASRRKPEVRRRGSQAPLDFRQTELRRSDTVAQPLATGHRFSKPCLPARPCRPVRGLGEFHLGEEGRWRDLARTWGLRHQATAFRPFGAVAKRSRFAEENWWEHTRSPNRAFITPAPPSRYHEILFGALGYALLHLLGLWRSLLGAVLVQTPVGERPLFTAGTAVLRLVQAVSARLAVSQNKPVAICAGREGAIRRLMMASPP
jgi:hypothetical protein